jgi:uncharacterized Zn finger protein
MLNKNVDRSKQITCPACGGEGKQEHILRENGKTYGIFTFFCVWCDATGAITWNTALLFAEAKEEHALQISSCKNN